MHVRVAWCEKLEVARVGRGACAWPKTRADLPTTTVAASDPRVGPRGPVCRNCEIFFVSSTHPSAEGQLSGRLRRRSWWVNGQVFSAVSMLYGQHEPPQVSHTTRHTHAPAAHPRCYLHRIRTGCGVDCVDFGRSIVRMATESAASKLLIRKRARFSLRHVQVSGTDRGGCGDVTQQSRSIMGPGRATGQPWAQNHPTLTGHSSLARAIDSGDLDMAERKSRALPDEVLT